ncbi:MAG: hypothetical protein ABI333_23935 [bacterium]
MSSSLLTLLRTLAEREIEFMVVGGMAGVLQGAPVVTADLDIVHRRSNDNVQRLLSTLIDLEAVFRGDSRKLEPKASHLMGQGHVLLITRLGPLDVFCEVGGRGFEELLPHCDSMQLGQQLEAQVVRLDELIRLKRAAGRPKDLVALPILQATLDELQRKK